MSSKLTTTAAADPRINQLTTGRLAENRTWRPVAGRGRLAFGSVAQSVLGDPTHQIHLLAGVGRHPNLSLQNDAWLKLQGLSDLSDLLHRANLKATGKVLSFKGFVDNKISIHGLEAFPKLRIEKKARLLEQYLAGPGEVFCTSPNETEKKHTGSEVIEPAKGYKLNRRFYEHSTTYAIAIAAKIAFSKGLKLERKSTNFRDFVIKKFEIDLKTREYRMKQNFWSSEEDHKQIGALKAGRFDLLSPDYQAHLWVEYSQAA